MKSLVINKPNLPQVVSCMAALLFSLNAFAQTQPPPTLGQDTKGAPAVEDAASDATKNDGAEGSNSPAGDTAEAGEAGEEQGRKTFGTAKFKESRRENGQIYLIELEHSSGIKQYIEENDSDGNIESKATDIEDTPNIPKWKLGSW